MTDRQIASQLSRKLLKGKISFQELVEAFPEDEHDKEIFKLFDLIEHEPATKGFFGVGIKRHNEYLNEIYDLIYKLNPPPNIIGGAETLFYIDLDDRFIKTNNTKHLGKREEIEKVSCLAICKYDDEPGFYLFGCDENWNSITDTYHNSISDAKEQAEFEYKNTYTSWRAK